MCVHICLQSRGGGQGRLGGLGGGLKRHRELDYKGVARSQDVEPSLIPGKWNGI